MQSVYIAGASAGSGKSVVVLGFMEMLSSVNRRIGFFRPFAPRDNGTDNLTNLISSRYDLPFPPEMLYGCTVETVRKLVGSGRYDELLKLIMNKYKMLEEHCDLVVCAGTDFGGLIPSLEFGFNVDLANNCGCALVPVVPGFGRNQQEAWDALHITHELMRERGADFLASIVNGVAPEDLETVKTRVRDLLSDTENVYVLPEQPSLGMPTVGEIAQVLDASTLYADEDGLRQAVTNYKIAAMEIPSFLGHIEDDSLIIAPGDRSDIILASLAADVSTAFPRVAGLLLTGGLRPAERVQTLIEGLRRTSVPILSVESDTFTTAMNLNRIEASILAGDKRKIAAGLGLFEEYVDVEELRERMSIRHSDRVTPIMFEYELIRRAKANRQRIVLPEGADERILRAAEILTLRQVADLTLLGNPDRIQRRISELGLKLDSIRIVDPTHSINRERYARTYYELRKHKGISEQMAYDLMEDVSYFGTLMVYQGDADGMVSGATHTTQHTIRPSFETVKTKPGVKLVSSVFFMCLPDQVLVYGDCAVNPNPNSEELADIAITSAATAAAFGIEPRIAMLSYSSGSSGKGEDVDRVREAVSLVRERHPELKVEGPIQYDAAVDEEIARSKMPGSDVAGHASVLVFPDLNTGNNTYKAVQRSAGAVAIGPVLQGLNKPVNDLSRGCTVTDIVNTVAITAIQAQAENDLRIEGNAE